MGCFQSTAKEPSIPVPERPNPSPATVPVPASTAPPPATESSLALSPPIQSTKSTNGSKVPSTHTTADSAPERAHSIWQPSSQEHGRGAMTLAVPHTSKPAPSMAGTRALIPTIRQELSNHIKFRILVVGKKGSGKSSLINAVFKVDTSAGSGNINREISSTDNRYLIFHECSGFASGDDQSLQDIRDFISHRTDSGRSTAERLHAVWICVPATDAMSGDIGEGVEEILNMNVPVIVAFTKFDQAVPIERGSSARTNARAKIEQSCHSLLHGDSRDVPAEIVSVRPEFSDLIDKLVATMDKVMTGSRGAPTPSERWRAQGPMPRVKPAPLVWSAALRVNQDIFIQASIEVGRSRYWRSLRNSVDFAEQPLKACINVIHTDIVEIWNLNDKTKYLSNSEFKARMSHVVRDLTGSISSVPPSPDFAEWVYDSYSGRQENVRCVMGYIVDLTVILDDIFRMTAGNVSAHDVQMAMDRHVNSGRRDGIHGDISNFVAERFESRSTMSQRDLTLEKIIDLIRQYCVPLSMMPMSLACAGKFNPYYSKTVIRPTSHYRKCPRGKRERT